MLSLSCAASVEVTAIHQAHDEKACGEGRRMSSASAAKTARGTLRSRRQPAKGEHAAAVSAPAGGWHEASTGKVVFSAHWPQTARREKQDTFRLFCRGDNSLLPYMQAYGVGGRDLGSWNSRVCVSLTANRRVCAGSCRLCVHMCVRARVCDPLTHPASGGCRRNSAHARVCSCVCQCVHARAYPLS